MSKNGGKNILNITLNKAKNIMKTTKKYRESKTEIDIEIYQMKKNISREDMQEIRHIKCNKKIS